MTENVETKRVRGVELIIDHGHVGHILAERNRVGVAGLFDARQRIKDRKKIFA